MSAMDDIRQTFFEECAEQMTEVETGLLAMEAGAADADTVNAVFRAVHSIKGGAGAFNFTELVAFAHVFETTLDAVRAGRLTVGAEQAAVLLRAADVLADLVAAAHGGAGVDAERREASSGELAKLLGEEGGVADAGEGDGMEGLDFTPVAVSFEDLAGGPAGAQDFRIVFRPHAGLYAKANEALRLIRECLALGEGSVACDTGAVPTLDALDPEGAYLSWTIVLSTTAGEAAVREIFEFVELDCDLTIETVSAPSTAEAQPGGDADIAALLARMQAEIAQPAAEMDATPPQPVPPEAERRKTTRRAEDGVATASSIRVELERVDRLIDLVGELVIHQVMLAQRAAQAGLAARSEVAVGFDELEQLTREIQDSVMAIRAQPVKSVFQKLPRLVREVAGVTGKSVGLVTEGEYTEVDKTVIERLSDPLTHMIRNAIDHGIETPDRRIAAGKPAEGTIRVAAMHRSGRIVIEVSDDGAGIDRPVVRDIAVGKGLIPAGAQLSDDETDNLIFLPGFSTKEAVSELSGRGVGMDVVKRSIQALGGRVSISSQPGKGSVFTMSLPLTLAVLDGMVVTAGDSALVVPITAIVETLKPRRGDVSSFGRDNALINVRDSFLPLIDVACELGYRATPTDPVLGVVVLVESDNGQRSALLFDAIQGQRQVVIKSLEANYGRVPGVAAATIMGDGRVALILDVDMLTAQSRFEQIASGQPAFNSFVQAAE
ncbi:MAG: chemotaxis protein CheA [Rhizobiaceae bacterium]